IQQMPQIVPALPQVKAELAQAREEAAEELNSLPKPKREVREKQIAQQVRGRNAGQLSLVQEVGGLVGRFLLALLAVRIVSRRALVRVFQVPGLILVPLVFAYAGTHNATLFELGDRPVTLLHAGMFVAGLL